MGKVVGNTLKGVGNAFSKLLGIDTSKPELPPVPPAPPVPPVTAVTTTRDATKAKMQDKRRVGRRQTIATGARGVTTEAPIEYKSLMGNAKTQTS